MLVKWDELREEMKDGGIFSGFQEGIIRFPPTFKVQKGIIGPFYLHKRLLLVVGGFYVEIFSFIFWVSNHFFTFSPSFLPSSFPLLFFFLFFSGLPLIVTEFYFILLLLFMLLF